MGMFGNDVTAVRLPNGTLQVLESNSGHKGEIFPDEKSLYAAFQHLNEGAGAQILIMSTINE